MAADAALLELHDVVAGYEEVEVLRGVSLAVRAGQSVCIIGANGAGKSTLLRTVFGMVPPRPGHIRFAGEEIAHRAPTEVLKRGIGHVPEGRCNFLAMTVEENIEMGAYLRRDPRVRDDIEALLARFPMLATNGRRAVPRPRPSDGRNRLRRDPHDQPRRHDGSDDRAEREGSALVSHHGFVLELGRNRFESTGAELLNDPDGCRHYLGG